MAVAERGAAPSSCLAITFTRRAAEELRLRLTGLLPRQARRMTVTTFHGLGLQILREYVARAGLSAGFTVADEQARLAVAASMTGSQRAGRRLLASADPGDRDALVKALTARDLVDLDGLVAQPVALLREDPSLATALACCVQDRWHPDGQDIRTHLRVAKKCR